MGFNVKGAQFKSFRRLELEASPALLRIGSGVHVWSVYSIFGLIMCSRSEAVALNNWPFGAISAN
jgi:hypothetical protein